VELILDSPCIIQPTVTYTHLLLIYYIINPNKFIYYIISNKYNRKQINIILNILYLYFYNMIEI